jgi:glycosyltransferase involved in cell wall biosynthesis
LNDSDYYTSKVEYGLERAKHFSWKNAAERLKSIYESME